VNLPAATPAAAAEATPGGGGPLRGLRVAVTRPRDQSQRLAAAIEAAGGEAIVFPLIEIGGPPDPVALDALLDRLDQFDWAVFSSPTAVDQAMQRILAVRGALPERCTIAAIGEGTLRALGRHGITRVLAPSERFDSEALLALVPLQDLRQRQVLIFRGQEGREVLADGLRARGAVVHYAECYTRHPPAGDAQPLLARARAATLDALVLTSSEALRNLLAMLGGAAPDARQAADLDLIRRMPVFVPHPRIAAAARSAGFVQVVETDGGDSGVLRALEQAAAVGDPAATRVAGR
jgi:uroporphyrinogen-III synthase